MGFILFIHIAACILLVTTILMQAGRGGGLAESFSSAESMFGTQTNSFMVKASTAFAVIFLATALVLAIGGTKGHKSLMSDKKLLPTQTQVNGTVDVPAEPKVDVRVESPVKIDETTVPAVVNAAK